MTRGSHSPVITADGQECDGRATKGTSMAAVEFQKDVGGFSDGKGHWYSVRMLSTRYVMVQVQLDPLTHRHVPVETLSTHASAAEAWTAAREEAERSAASEQEF